MKTTYIITGTNMLVRSATAVMVACVLASDVSAENNARQEALPKQQEALRQVYGDQPERVSQNWSKLRDGLSVDEVDALVGPLDKNFKDRTRSSGSTFESTSTYGGALYTLKFRAGKLNAWWRNRP